MFSRLCSASGFLICNSRHVSIWLNYSNMSITLLLCHRISISSFSLKEKVHEIFENWSIGCKMWYYNCMTSNLGRTYGPDFLARSSISRSSSLCHNFIFRPLILFYRHFIHDQQKLTAWQAQLLKSCVWLGWGADLHSIWNSWPEISLYRRWLTSYN